MKRTNRVQQSVSDWPALIQKQAISNLSVSAFCKQHHISDQSFYAWPKRLAALSVESTPAINLVDIASMVSSSPSARWQIELDLV